MTSAELEYENLAAELRQIEARAVRIRQRMQLLALNTALSRPSQPVPCVPISEAVLDFLGKHGQATGMEIWEYVATHSRVHRAHFEKLMSVMRRDGRIRRIGRDPIPGKPGTTTRYALPEKETLAKIA